MQRRWCDEPIDYDGSQLRAHWLLTRFGLVGDAIVGFRGRCDVVADEVADLEDLDGPGIRGDDMVHFVWECFGATDLLLAVHRQRLLAAQVREVLRELAPTADVTRTGDDLYVCTDRSGAGKPDRGERTTGRLSIGKLSISIATVSPVSALIHFAVNAQQGGAPVPVASLADLGVPVEPFALAVLDRVVEEQRSIADARAKVRAKGEWR